MTTSPSVAIALWWLSGIVLTQASLAQDTALCAASGATKNCEKLIEEEEGKEDNVQASVDFNFKGDRAPGTRASELTLGVNLDYGVYPTQLQVKTQTTFKDSAGETNEDVNEALFTLDHYLRHNLATFAFAERLTDSFLSLDPRWDVGLGLEFEFNSRDRTAVKRKGLRFASGGVMHDLLHPEEVDLPCTPSGWKQGLSDKRAWYHLTPAGYERLEAWASEYRDAHREMARLRVLENRLCGATTAAQRNAAVQDFHEFVLRPASVPMRPPPAGKKLPEVRNLVPCGGLTRVSDLRVSQHLAAAFNVARELRDGLSHRFCGQHARSLEKRYSRWSFEASAAVLWELERAVLEVKDDDLRSTPITFSSDNGPTEKFTLPGETRTRFSWRLATRYRATDRLQFRLQYFEKEALDSPENGLRPVAGAVNEPHSELFLKPRTSVGMVGDKRSEYFLSVALNASDDITLAFDASLRDDDTPPVAQFSEGGVLLEEPDLGLPPQDPEEVPALFIFARDRHWIYKLTVRFKLKG